MEKGRDLQGNRNGSYVNAQQLLLGFVFKDFFCGPRTGFEARLDMTDDYNHITDFGFAPFDFVFVFSTDLFVSAFAISIDPSIRLYLTPSLLFPTSSVGWRGRGRCICPASARTVPDADEAAAGQHLRRRISLRRLLQRIDPQSFGGRQDSVRPHFVSVRLQLLLRHVPSRRGYAHQRL